MSQEKILSKIINAITKEKIKLERQNENVGYSGGYSPALCASIDIIKKSLAIINNNIYCSNPINKSYSDLKKELKELERQNESIGYSGGYSPALCSQIDTLKKVLGIINPYVTEQENEFTVSKTKDTTDIKYGKYFGISIKGSDNRININGQDIDGWER